MKKLALAGGAALFLAGTTLAGDIGTPAVEFSADGLTADGSNGPWTLGYEFTVLGDLPLIVTALGYYDNGRNGLQASHQVGLWDNSGVLLAQATVTTADVLLGNFRYATLTSGGVILKPGASYRVGGLSGGDLYTWDTVGFTEAPEIDYVRDRWNFGTQLTFPNDTSGVQNGFFGGTFAFVIPAPGAFALLGMAGLVARRRRR